jgi:hypothetical protein
MSKIAEYIRMLARQEGTRIYPATVTAVNGSTCDVTPLSGDAELEQVRLNSDVSNDLGILCTPTVGSIVLVAEISETDALVVMFAEIDKISLKIGASTLEITDGLIEMNGGNNDGLVVVGDLVSKLNAIEQDINNLKAAFSAWVVLPNDGGAALKTAAATWYAATLTQTQQSDIENTKVTH